MGTDREVPEKAKNKGKTQAATANTKKHKDDVHDYIDIDMWDDDMDELQRGSHSASLTTHNLQKASVTTHSSTAIKNEDSSSFSELSSVSHISTLNPTPKKQARKQQRKMPTRSTRQHTIASVPETPYKSTKSDHAVRMRLEGGTLGWGFMGNLSDFEVGGEDSEGNEEEEGEEEDGEKKDEEEGIERRQRAEYARDLKSV